MPSSRKRRFMAGAWAEADRESRECQVGVAHRMRDNNDRDQQIRSHCLTPTPAPGSFRHDEPWFRGKHKRVKRNAIDRKNLTTTAGNLKGFESTESISLFIIKGRSEATRHNVMMQNLCRCILPCGLLRSVKIAPKSSLACSNKPHFLDHCQTRFLLPSSSHTRSRYALLTIPRWLCVCELRILRVLVSRDWRLRFFAMWLCLTR